MPPKTLLKAMDAPHEERPAPAYKNPHIERSDAFYQAMKHYFFAHTEPFPHICPNVTSFERAAIQHAGFDPGMAEGGIVIDATKNTAETRYRFPKKQRLSMEDMQKLSEEFGCESPEAFMEMVYSEAFAAKARIHSATAGEMDKSAHPKVSPYLPHRRPEMQADVRQKNKHLRNYMRQTDRDFWLDSVLGRKRPVEQQAHHAQVVQQFLDGVLDIHPDSEFAEQVRFAEKAKDAEAHYKRTLKNETQEFTLHLPEGEAVVCRIDKKTGTPPRLEISVGEHRFGCDIATPHKALLAMDEAAKKLKDGPDPVSLREMEGRMIVCTEQIKHAYGPKKTIAKG